MEDTCYLGAIASAVSGSLPVCSQVCRAGALSVLLRLKYSGWALTSSLPSGGIATPALCQACQLHSPGPGPGMLNHLNATSAGVSPATDSGLHK